MRLFLQEDPSVYQYDEIYDSMKEDKQKKIAVSKQDKTSKYAKNLIRNAAIRKLENDRWVLMLSHFFIWKAMLGTQI